MSIPDQILPWQDDVWNELIAYVKQRRIPQALMFAGPKGLGKQQLAMQFAKLLLCQNNNDLCIPCGQCKSCKLFNAQTHPDFISVHPDEAGKDITIAQIRKLIAELNLKPLFAGYRVVVINSAQRMNNAAANGFLKCLEEPNARTIIILITEQPSSLPATINSRCQKLYFTVPERQIGLSWLQQHCKGEDFQSLLCLACGAPLLAYEYAQNDRLKIRLDCFNAWLNIARQQSNPVSIAEQWSKLSDPQVLLWMITWVIDAIKFRFHCNPCYLYNPDLKDDLQELVQQLDLENLFAFYDLLLISRQRFNTQLNKQILFEEILINWSQTTSMK